MKKGNIEILFFRSVTPRSQNAFLNFTPGAFGESRDLAFSPSRSNLGLVSSRLARFVRNREIYNLGMLSGPVILKIKGKSWIFILLGVKACFVTKSVRFCRTELSICRTGGESRDL